MPENLRGHDSESDDDRQNPNCDNNINISDDTEIIHLGRRSQNECAVLVNIGKKSFKSLWDSGSGKCVISYDCNKSKSIKLTSLQVRSGSKLPMEPRL